MAEVSIADKLCNACASGNTAEVLFLLGNGADVNGLNSFNRTPIQVAKQGKPSLFKVLLQAGADPNVPDPVLNLTVTHDVARDGHKDTGRVLLDYGANPNLVDVRGNLPLHLAAMGGHLELTQMLIGCTVDPQTRNGQGFTAAELAQHHGKTDVFNFIQQYLDARNVIRRHGINFHSYAEDSQLYVAVSLDDTGPLDAIFNCVLDNHGWQRTAYQDKTQVYVIGAGDKREKLTKKKKEKKKPYDDIAFAYGLHLKQ